MSTRKFKSRKPSDKRNSRSKVDYDNKGATTKVDTSKNDVSWYTRNEQLVLDAGRLSFNVPTGSPILWDTSSIVTQVNTRDLTKYVFPGVMRLEFIPTYGITNSANDPLNVAARNIYSWVRYANSGAKNYDPNDLMLYLMAMDNCYMMYQKLCRIYGVTRVFSQLNRHFPSTLADALNFDYNDVLSNLSDFRAYLNTVAAKLGSLCVPADMPIYNRHMWMEAGIYSDAPTAKSQIYVFDLSDVGRYVENSGTGGYIEAVDVRGTNCDTVAKMKTIMDSLINALIGSEDCGIISGDIRKKYDGRLMQVSGIADDYTVLPMYSEEVLRQIQNATIFNGYTLTSGKMIVQDMVDNILKSNIQIHCKSAFYQGNRIMTGSDQTPSPEEVLVNSRFMVTGEITQIPPLVGTASASNPNIYAMTPSAIGTEIISMAKVYGVPDKSSGTPVSSNIVEYAARYDNDLTTTTNKVITMYKFLSAYSKVENFNYHPRVGFVSSVTADSTGTISNEDVFSLQDVDNYCVVNETVLYNLHNTALLSLFDIPVMGTKQ